MKKCISFLLAIFVLLNFSFAKKKNKTKNKVNPDLPTEDVEFSISADDLPDGKTAEPLPLYTLRSPQGEPVRLRESWGYVMQTRLDEYTPGLPLTDICFFAGEVNCYGELVGAPSRSKINTNKHNTQERNSPWLTSSPKALPVTT